MNGTKQSPIDKDYEGSIEDLLYDTNSRTFFRPTND